MPRRRYSSAAWPTKARRRSSRQPGVDRRRDPLAEPRQEVLRRGVGVEIGLEVVERREHGREHVVQRRDEPRPERLAGRPSPLVDPRVPVDARQRVGERVRVDRARTRPARRRGRPDRRPRGRRASGDRRVRAGHVHDVADAEHEHVRLELEALGRLPALAGLGVGAEQVDRSRSPRRRARAGAPSRSRRSSPAGRTASPCRRGRP